MRCRKTLTGVDLNRNWPVGWRHNPPFAEEYGGEQPLSEPESRTLAQLGRDWRPHTYVQVHSGEWALYTNWVRGRAPLPSPPRLAWRVAPSSPPHLPCRSAQDHKAEWGSELPSDTHELLTRMNVHCACTNGAAGAVSGYLAFGSSMDYFYQVSGL